MIRDLAGLTPGAVYYVQMDGFDESASTGTITVTAREIPVPTVSGWSLVVMTLLGVTVVSIIFGRRRRTAAAG
ncbi:MAG: hypothetical protein IH987_18675 [Planctomycetes bacterium]|nr:hypothetical protein [Planctomycetota bacterium]